MQGNSSSSSNPRVSPHGWVKQSCRAIAAAAATHVYRHVGRVKQSCGAIASAHMCRHIGWVKHSCRVIAAAHVYYHVEGVKQAILAMVTQTIVLCN